MALSYVQTIFADTPLAYYRMDEVIGLVAHDVTTNGNNGTISSTGIVYGQPGAIPADADTSMLFDGINGQIIVPGTVNPFGHSGFTYEAWFFVGTYSATARIITNEQSFEIGTLTSNSGLYADVGTTGNTDYHLSYNATINTNQWYHVVASYTGSSFTLYLNGVSVATTAATGTILNTANAIVIASSPTVSNVNFPGRMDEVAIYSYGLTAAQVLNHYNVGITAPVSNVATTRGYVQLLINDVYYPTIRQETINIDRTANDPIPTFKITLQDDPSQIALSELMEIVFIDGGQISNPTHNLLKNPILNPFATSWTQATATGGSFAQQTLGVKLTSANATGSFGLSQITQNGLVVAGQTYMLSCFIQSSTLVALAPFIQISYLAPNGTVLSSQSLSTGTMSSLNVQYSLSLTAPTGTALARISFGMLPSSGTNSGNAIFSNIQFEPMSFTTGNTQISYPTPFCANGQQNCTLMPDGTSIRQYRLFGGYITKATAGRYIGNNRQWTVTVSGYAWLLQKQILNNNYTNKTDAFIMKDLVANYFPNQFNTAQIATGSTLDTFGYTYNGTARDAFDALAANSNFAYIIGPYREIIYQANGYNQIGFLLSDRPDNVTSFPYYNYSLDIDGTQLGNATLVTGATNISAIEYDAQSIGYYNQKTNGLGIFWRTVSDSTITTTTAARQRALAENSQYNYARPIVHLTTNQIMIPGYTVLFSSATDDLFDMPFIIQKSTLTLSGFVSLQVPFYECVCDLGAFNPDFVNIIAKLQRKQLANSNSVGTPVLGLMVTENTTFLDTINVNIVTGSPATYGMGIYGTSVYAFSIPSVPSTLYGTGFYGDSAHGYA